MFDTSTLNFNSILNKFAAVAWSQFSFFDEQMNRCIFRYEIDEIGKNQDKSIKTTSVSSISTDWSIQSISIKSDLPIFIDLSIFSIDYSGTIVNISRWLRKQREHGLLQLYRNSADETAAGRAAENFPDPLSMILFANWQLCIYYSGWYSE